jgi:hypothetical protein
VPLFFVARLIFSPHTWQVPVVPSKESGTFVVRSAALRNAAVPVWSKLSGVSAFLGVPSPNAAPHLTQNFPLGHTLAPQDLQNLGDIRYQSQGIAESEHVTLERLSLNIALYRRR